MNQTELIVIVVGALGGYWLVSFLLRGKVQPEAKRTDPPPQDKSSGEQAHDGTQQRYESPPSAKEAKTWYEVLEVKPSASVSEIRTAYRQLISQYRPDKVEALGAELKELAVRKSKEFNEAYEMAMAMRGEST